jgi:acyl-CoA thioester hydrolase
MEGRTSVRVRYSDTDKMGVAHHAAYLHWFELGRTELLRAAGRSYREMEEGGVKLPVVEAQARYHSSAEYDDELLVETQVHELRRVQLAFSYRISRAGDGQLLATGTTRHAVLDADNRPSRLPGDVRGLLGGA